MGGVIVGTKYTKTVKGMKRGKNLSSKLHRYFIWILLLLITMIFGSAYLYWSLESAGKGSFADALWTVVFTLIGQGEFAKSPNSIIGRSSCSCCRWWASRCWAWCSQRFWPAS